MTAPSQHALGIDVGTTNTKVALVACAPAVRVVAQASAPTPAPAGLERTLRELLRTVLIDGPVPEAVGIASMAETGVPLDTAGAPLGDWLRWDEQRAGREAVQLCDRLGRDELIRATGVRPSAKVPLATLAWLRGQHPDTFDAMARWSGAADLVCLLLTGRLATDHTLAGRTMAYLLPTPGRPLAAQFDAELLAEVGLRAEQLPDVVVAGPAGPTRDAWRAAGLPAGTPVTVAGHDHAVGAYAAGMRRPGQAADSVGTAEAVLTVVAAPPDPLAAAAAGMSSVVTVDAAQRALLAGSPAAGGFVRWWLEKEAAGRAPDELFADALALGDEPSEVFVLPYLRGRQAPAPDPDADVQVLGRRADHAPAALARAMLQGLCLQARWLLEEQARLAGVPGEEPVVALGGPLLGNPAWLRLKALVGPRPLHLVTEPEAVAAGAALVAAARAGLIDADDALLAAQPVSVRTELRAGYDRTFAEFVAAATGRTVARGAPR